jgi:hypothetical protein
VIQRRQWSVVRGTRWPLAWAAFLSCPKKACPEIGSRSREPSDACRDPRNSHEFRYANHAYSEFRDTLYVPSQHRQCQRRGYRRCGRDPSPRSSIACLRVPHFLVLSSCSTRMLRQRILPLLPGCIPRRRNSRARHCTLRLATPPVNKHVAMATNALLSKKYRTESIATLSVCRPFVWWSQSMTFRQ